MVQQKMDDHKLKNTISSVVRVQHFFTSLKLSFQFRHKANLIVNFCCQLKYQLIIFCEVMCDYIMQYLNKTRLNILFDERIKTNSKDI